VLISFLVPSTVEIEFTGVACFFAVVLAFAVSKRRAHRPILAAPSDGKAVDSKTYHLILDALERSNVLLWWARVTREGSAYKWNIHTPPLIGKNPIYRLASLVDQDWLWKDEQSPDHEKMNQTSSKALKEGASGYQQEFPIIGPDAIHWLREEVTIRPEGPNEWNLMGVIVDVTKRHEAEEALLQEEALFSNLVSTSPDHIYFKDRQSRFIRINGAMARAFGIRDASEAVGKLDSDIFAEEHARQAFLDEQRIMETGEPMIGAEEKETWPDGRITWASTTKVPMRDARGNITGLIGVSRDVTERRLADAQLREQNEILSNSHEGVIVVNLANKITLWNRAAEKITGWSQNEALGREPMELLRVEDQKVLPTIRETSDRVGFWTGEIQAKRRWPKDDNRVSRHARPRRVESPARPPQSFCRRHGTKALRGKAPPRTAH
jgi:PAS domain S-box-containing protein